MFSVSRSGPTEAVTDGALVASVLSGDRAAFATLYRAHVRVVSIAVRDNVHDAESVADVVQEVFVRALERLATLRDPNRFGPWLLSIARHAAIDHRRSVRKTPVLLEYEAERPAPGPGPDMAVEANELTTLVERCIAGLSPRDATALTLVSRFGLGPADIAECLGVSNGAAKVIVHRGRRRLRDALALEILTRRPAGDCLDFDVLCDAGDLVSAGRHVRSCAVCDALATSGVGLYRTDRLGARS